MTSVFLQSKTCQTHGQNQSGVGSRVGSGDGWGGGCGDVGMWGEGMETTVLEQQ